MIKFAPMALLLVAEILLIASIATYWTAYSGDVKASFWYLLYS
jgi:hypothetical protein